MRLSGPAMSRPRRFFLGPRLGAGPGHMQNNIAQQKYIQRPWACAGPGRPLLEFCICSVYICIWFDIFSLYVCYVCCYMLCHMFGGYSSFVLIVGICIAMLILKTCQF